MSQELIEFLIVLNVVGLISLHYKFRHVSPIKFRKMREEIASLKTQAIFTSAAMAAFNQILKDMKERILKLELEVLDEITEYRTDEEIIHEIVKEMENDVEMAAKMGEKTI